MVGKQAGIIDAHRVHPAPAQFDVAHLAGLRLLGGAQRIARDAAAHVLKAHLARHQRLRPLARPGEHELAQHLVLDEGQKFVEALVLVMVRIDVGDQKVVEIALVRLAAGVGQEPAGIKFFDGNAAAAVGEKVHWRNSGGMWRRRKRMRRAEVARRGARLTRFGGKSHPPAAGLGLPQIRREASTHHHRQCR